MIILDGTTNLLGAQVTSLEEVDVVLVHNVTDLATTDGIILGDISSLELMDESIQNDINNIEENFQVINGNFSHGKSFILAITQCSLQSINTFFSESVSPPHSTIPKIDLFILVFPETVGFLARIGSANPVCLDDVLQFPADLTNTGNRLNIHIPLFDPSML